MVANSCKHLGDIDPAASHATVQVLRLCLRSLQAAAVQAKLDAGAPPDEVEEDEEEEAATTATTSPAASLGALGAAAAAKLRAVGRQGFAADGGRSLARQPSMKVAFNGGKPMERQKSMKVLANPLERQKSSMVAAQQDSVSTGRCLQCALCKSRMSAQQ